MSKLALLVFALYALHAITDAYLVSSDPLVSAKIQVQNDIQTINAQISMNNRYIGLKISPIRRQQSIALKFLIAEMERTNSECAITNLRDAQSIWQLIDSLDSCRFNQNYGIIKTTAMQILNQLVGDAGRAIDGCRQQVDYHACASSAATEITESSARVRAQAVEDANRVAEDSDSCLATSADDLQNRIDALRTNWNACKAN